MKPARVVGTAPAIPPPSIRVGHPVALLIHNQDPEIDGKAHVVTALGADGQGDAGPAGDDDGAVPAVALDVQIRKRADVLRQGACVPEIMLVRRPVHHPILERLPVRAPHKIEMPVHDAAEFTGDSVVAEQYLRRAVIIQIHHGGDRVQHAPFFGLMGETIDIRAVCVEEVDRRQISILPVHGDHHDLDLSVSVHITHGRGE